MIFYQIALLREKIHNIMLHKKNFHKTTIVNMSIKSSHRDKKKSLFQKHLNSPDPANIDQGLEYA